jgi:hypothetical protein
MGNVTAKELACRLAALLPEFSAAELLAHAHAWLILPGDDPRHKRMYLALAAAVEAEKAGDRNAAFEHDQEFALGLLQLVQ